MSIQRTFPVTFLIPVYNEERRIRQVLDHAVRWADEVVVADKSSTDATRDICRGYGPKVRIVELPFSPKGDDDFVSLVEHSSNDWIFVGTASEIPTRKLIGQARKILDDTNGTLDLVYVPRKIYSFGIHSARSPWSVTYYAFLFNRKKATVRNVIHSNFSPSNPLNIARIEYSEDCCVHHFTHPSAKGYVHDMAMYFEAEADGTSPEALTQRMADCLKQRAQYEHLLKDGGENLFGHYCAWQIYWLGTALFLWEKKRSIDVPGLYTEIGAGLLKREWFSETVASDTPSTAPGPVMILLAKTAYLFRMACGTASRILSKKEHT